MSEFEKYLEHVLDGVSDSVVKEAMKYSLLAGGKRIRPQLLFSALEAYGLKETQGYTMAAAIEMIHTYSLIHDDLPAMDNDTLRRGLPTCHVKFNEAIAILAGDALLTQAFVQGCEACDDSKIALSLTKLLAQYSGADGMVLGQIKDLKGELDTTIDVEGLQDIHFYKTGKLITLPLLSAAILARHEEHMDTWIQIGKYIGLSFQIQDDILDVTSSNEVLGKNVNSDVDNHKHTYVSLMGIEEAQKSADMYYRMAWELVEALPIDSAAMKPVFDTLTKRKH